MVRWTNICSPCVTDEDTTLLGNSQSNWPLIIVIVDLLNWWTGETGIATNISTCQILRSCGVDGLSSDKG